MKDILPADKKSKTSFDQTTTCCETCTKGNNKYGQGISATLMNRVLDVGRECEPYIKLCETASEPARYFCLSHCWGDFRPEILTASMTIESKKEVVPLDRLPATYRDAILVTRRQDVRYL